MSARSIRALILCAVAAALALPLAGQLLPLDGAFAIPCQNCPGKDSGDGGGEEPDPVPAPSPDPEDPPGGGTPGPVVTKESETHTLSVETERGRVTDGSGIDCPSGACRRSWTYETTCSNGDCNPYNYLTVTLTLTPEAGYTAKWDGCTPRPGDPAKCDVRMDTDRHVRVLWTKATGDGAGIDAQPLRDGGAVAPGDTSVAPGTVLIGTVETPAATGRRGVIRSTVRYSFRRSTTWTEFTLLKIRHIPAGATSRVTCKGTRCPNGATVSTRSRSVKLNRFTGRRYAVGTAITIRVTHPRKRGRTTKMVVRKGKDPRITHP